LELMRDALFRHEQLFGVAHPDTLGVGYRLALTLLGDEEQSGAARFEEAEALLALQLPRLASALGEAAPQTLSAQLLHGRVACYAGRAADCARRIEAVLPEARRVLGEQSLSLLRAQSEFAVALIRIGRAEEGREQLRSAADNFEQRWNHSGRHGSRHGFGLNLASAALL